MKARTVSLAEVGVRAPFADLFRIEPKVRDAIAADMRTNGYDLGEPIDVWDDGGGLVVVDGHTRFECAGILGIGEIPVVEYDFQNDYEALAHSLHKQKDRRNWKGGELVDAVKLLDETMKQSKGGDRGNQYTGGKTSIDVLPPSGHTHNSSQAIADLLNVSSSTVDRARAIYPDPEAMAEVKAGASIAVAAEIARAKKRIAPPPKVDENGTKPTAPDIRDEPWFTVKDAGREAEHLLLEAARGIRKELDKLAAAGLSVAPLMGDRRVSPGWNKARKQVNEIAALLRATMHGATNGKDE